MKRRARPSKERPRIFRGLEIEEAKADLFVQPSQGDIDGATKESPTNCMYAQCLKRVLNTKNIFVFKTVAYIESLNEKGERRMRRYQVRTYAREHLIKFDHGEKIKAGGFVFHAPNKSQTLAYKQKETARLARLGKISPRVSTGKKPNMRNYSLRNGKGCVHLFSANEDQITPRK